jgi:tetratricopeptide (TPR) repeat protein
MTNQRRRLYFGIMIAFPFLLFGFIEGGLRLMGYGPDLSLFTTETINGRTYHIMNPGVKHRYFTRVAFLPSTSPDYFLVPKPAGTYRIFCLGGSTTVGFPYWYNAAFSSFLRDRLRAVFPGKTIEVINLGMTATNSFTALDMTREVLDYEPDLIIVYDGHNEFYGALGVASRESMGGSRWLANLSLRLIHLRTFLAMRDGYAMIGKLFAGDDPSSRGTMMEKLARGRYIPSGSDLYRDGLDAFRANLGDIRDLCSSRNVPVILGTQVSNLRGLPPFISTDASALSPEEQLKFHASFNAGQSAMMNGSFASALVSFRDALQLLPYHAEAHFRMARCLDTLGRHAEAQTAYRLARDNDELRFRTSTDFNEAILAMDDGRLTTAVDMERIFAAHSRDSLIGYGLILEHLHPSSYGQFLLARGYAEAMRSRALFAPADEWERRDTISDAALWRDRRVTPLDDRLAERRTEVLVTAWPFQEEEGLVSSIATTDTLGLIADRATRGEIHWLQAHEGAVEYYGSRGDVVGLEREYRTIIDQFPVVNVLPYLQLARVYLETGRISDMETLLRTSLTVKPTLLAYRALGDIALRTKRPEEAEKMYSAMFTFVQSAPEQVENGYLLALAHRGAGHTDLAMKRLAEVLRLKPDHAPAIALMAEINGK